jgi:restriction system protein
MARKSMTTALNQLARAAAAEARRKERERIAEAKRQERARIAEAKRLERERIANQKKALAQAKKLEKQRITQEKKRKAEAERERKTQLKREKADYIENNKTIANNRTAEAQNLLKSMENILNHALINDCIIDFDSDLFNEEFPIPKPDKPPEPEKPDYKNFPQEPTYQYPTPKPSKPPIPEEPNYVNIPPQPDPNDPIYNPKFGTFDFSNRKKIVKREARERLEADLYDWEIKKQEIIEYNQKIQSEHEYNLKNHDAFHQQNLEKWENDIAKFIDEQKIDWEREMQAVHEFNQKLKLEHEAQLKVHEKSHQLMLEDWENQRNEFLKEQENLNSKIDSRKQEYYNLDPVAIEYYSKNILENSEYHNKFPKQFELEYNPENQILLIDYQLPSLDDIPTLKEVKYIQTRDEFTEKHITNTQLNKLYDNILYQIPLRTIYELYNAHDIDAIQAIIFNGIVHSIDPATGQETDSCVLSVQANKEEFEEINLEMVEPKACFKKLKGVGSSKLHSLTPIPPIIKMNREDSRFIESYAVVDGIDEGYNLASMDWEDFENLIRELFEQAFAETGGEVKVTQASRDGGIDAVIFDPDPLRGGKIVVQAKRYTNVVGVSAVRDLYGTLLNEGANKGILVTTSDYGPDAYKFADDKPIQLLNGSNLLHLLEQYGHKARIDLNEAKKQLYG